MFDVRNSEAATHLQPGRRKRIEPAACGLDLSPAGAGWIQPMGHIFDTSVIKYTACLSVWEKTV